MAIVDFYKLCLDAFTPLLGQESKEMTEMHWAEMGKWVWQRTHCYWRRHDSRFLMIYIYMFIFKQHIPFVVSFLITLL